MPFLRSKATRPAAARGGSLFDELRRLEERLKEREKALDARESALRGTPLDHVGIAVRDAKKVLPIYAAIGLKPHLVEDVESEGVRTTFLGSGFSHIELLEPLRPDSPIGGFLEKRGEGIHHVAVAVDDIEATLLRARADGLQVVGEAPRAGARGRRVAFFYPNSVHGVLLEIVENPRLGRAR